MNNVRNLVNNAKIFGLAVVSVFVMGACKNRNHKDVIIVKDGRIDLESNTVDTFRVVGVYDVEKIRTFYCVDKYGVEQAVIINVGKKGSHQMTDAIFIERGDTIVLKGDKFVNNLTTQRLKNEFVNEKQKGN